jgi:Predicted membrane protein/domain
VVNPPSYPVNPPAPPAVAAGGGAMPGPPADLGTRFLARLIDGGITLIPLVCAGLIVSATENAQGEPSPGAIFIALPAYAAVILYEWVMLAASGQTFGKRIMKIKVVRVDGRPLGWAAAFARVYVQVFVSMVSCGIGGLLFVLSPLFDSSPWKRGWPDQLASSVVIRVG